MKLSVDVNSKGFIAMVTQFAHFGMAFTAVCSSALLAGHYFVWCLGAFLAFATGKEMWFDPHFENQGGKPDWLDLSFYLLGITLALVVLTVHGHLIAW